MLQIYDLKTEYLVDPIGLDEVYPRFSWKLKSDKKGAVQRSYHISATSKGKVIWDSGLIESDETQRIRYDGEPLVSRQVVFWKVQITLEDHNGEIESASSEEAMFEMGLLQKEDWVAKWVEPEGEVDKEARKPAPYLRREFTVKKKIESARIYQTAHGLYDFWINGNEGTKDRFKPGLTSYYYRIQYQVYDITKLIKEGVNSWAVALGDGWWRGVTGGTVKNNFGYKLHYFGQIELYYKDGTREIIGSDELFQSATGGLLASDMLMGDIFDAAKEPKQWKLPGFNATEWNFVHIADEHIDAELISSRSVPVREKEEFIPEVFIDAAGNRVLDFGQNIAGFVRMKLRNCESGKKVRLIHGEELKDGIFSVDNIKNTSLNVPAFQEVTYICSGDEEETYCPMFSIFGFRYVKLEGYEEDIKEGDFTAIAVYTDMEETGAFTCSNPLVNKLVENSRWSQKGNFMDVPVDCPTRERNAWTGDAQIFVRTATDFMNVYTFFEKWLKDQSIEQYESGKVGITFPSTSSVHNPEELEHFRKSNPLASLAGPTGDGNIAEDSAGWGDSTAWIPYMLYLCYGDKQILANQYETAKRWVDYMLACAKEPNPLYEDQPQYHHSEAGELDANYIYDTRMHLGEWMEPIPKEHTGESSLGEIFARMVKEGNPKVATAYMCRSASNVAHMAQILGLDEDYKRYSKIVKRIKRVYDKYLIAEDGTIEPGHQASYVRALSFGLCSSEKEDLVVKRLIEEIENNGYCLNTGFLSTPFLLHVLVDKGFTEVAYRILEQTENPSWLHSVKLGATTILERWDGLDHYEESFNHYSYGAVCDFLFSRVAGITPKFENPGYKQFELCPVIGGTFTFAEASYESLYGKIFSRWEKIDNKLLYQCSIPVNTKARILLPDGSIQVVGSGDFEYQVNLS